MTAPGVDDHDEEKARSAWVGTLAHRMFAHLLTELDPGRGLAHDLVSSCRRAALANHLLGPHRIENRAHRQTLLAAGDSYLRYLLPPSDWAFLTSEHPLPPGRVDLIWVHRDGGVLIDEVKTGRFDIGTAATSDQCQRYLHSATARYGTAFVGIRVVSVRDPPSSWVLRPDGRSEPLAGSGLLASERFPRRLHLRPIPGPSGRPVR